eukprot:143884-Rhodomonas_salina.7
MPDNPGRSRGNGERSSVPEQGALTGDFAYNFDDTETGPLVELLASLEALTALSVLDLSDCRVFGDKVRRLLVSVGLLANHALHPQAQDLPLPGIGFGWCESAELLLARLKRSESAELLLARLKRSGLAADTGIALASGLGGCASLEMLELDDKFCVSVMMALAAGLRTSSTLTCMSLQRNAFEHAPKAVGGLLMRRRALTSLDVARPGMQSDRQELGWRYLTPVTQLPSLRPRLEIVHSDLNNLCTESRTGADLRQSALKGPVIGVGLNQREIRLQHQAHAEEDFFAFTNLMV